MILKRNIGQPNTAFSLFFSLELTELFYFYYGCLCLLASKETPHKALQVGETQLLSDRKRPVDVQPKERLVQFTAFECIMDV